VTAPRRSLYLARLRTTAGDTMAQAAARVHVDVRTWERWESDDNGPSKRSAPEHAIHLYALLTGQPYEPPRS
jgi:hypothetical protein